MPSNLSLEARQNATFRLGCEARIGTRTGELEDLTGCTARMQIRSNWEDEEANLDLTTGSGGIVLGGEAGTINIVITDEQMMTLPVPTINDVPAGSKTPFQNYVYDLLITYPSGDVVCFLEGVFKVYAAVTHDD